MTDPIPASEIEAIRARHEAYKEAKTDDAFYSSPNGYPPPSTNKIADVAHADRAALLRALDEALAALLAIRDTARTALGYLDDPTGGAHVQDMRQSSDVLRAALKETEATEFFQQLAKRQEPLGAEFEAAIGDRSTLYEIEDNNKQ